MVRNVEAAKKQQGIELESKRIDKTNAQQSLDALVLAVQEIVLKQQQAQQAVEEARADNARAAQKNLEQHGTSNEGKELRVELATRKAQVEREKAQVLANIEMSKNSKKQLSDEIKAIEGKKSALSKEVSTLLPQLEENKKKRIQAEAIGAQLVEEFNSLTSQV
jgi:hypothetical protein